MRPLTLTALLSMLMYFSSCVPTWQYITLDSREVTKDASKRLFFENDTISLVYSYNGYGGPIRMSITNKTDKPMYVNWKKSAIIDRGYARSLFQPNVQMSGSFVSETQKTSPRGYTTTSGNLAGSFSLPDGMDFMPPGSTISKELDLVVSSNPLDPDQFTGSPKALKATKKGLGINSYKLYTFEQSSSPVQFKSYLTFVVDSDNAREFSVSHTFYAREIMLAGYSPQFFIPYKREGDMLYMMQRKQ
ncbi:MAG: hypothetical protein J0H74_35370 [Chitinophagaceae bacterium]|nr:hypothetical protein [Chitinophagaceae bacterium]